MIHSTDDIIKMIKERQIKYLDLRYSYVGPSCVSFLVFRLYILQLQDLRELEGKNEAQSEMIIQKWQHLRCHLC